MHGACNAEGTLLSRGTSLQHANVNSESATTLLHTSDSLVVSEMQRMHGRHDCRHQQPSSVGLQLSNTPPQPLRELHRAQARANNLRILATASAHRMARGLCLGRRPGKGHTPQDLSSSAIYKIPVNKAADVRPDKKASFWTIQYDGTAC